jgi:hypothetical protein
MKVWNVRTVRKTQKYAPYDSIGMNRFILDGLEEGIVLVNDEEVVVSDDGTTWKKKQ